MRPIRYAMTALTAILIAEPTAAEDGFREPDFITIGAGGFDINDNMTAGQFDIQLRFNTKLWIFRPHAGLFITTDQAFYGWAGIHGDVYFGRRFVLTPSFSVGGFEESDGKDLGGPLEFRSALEFAYRFDDASRLGVQIGHLSNASIYDSNPGEEFAILTYSIPTTVFDR
ncbi:MAG: acyloxyacyl hydrolase [Alphaproteobacteria bacterium]|nr:acyloxyacyl hydrolase [Alphaproteobacteria bacterium]MDP6238619.1 acyloxyacyl hydrolase [Alphaproteobacteria bacterium]MDP7172564.1 acyloxyacyl hydrolase [Alphaproteobacteria bacterium]MDP7234203.1 acyloxyacyl hydrolase [Alphaproteobacteria bacterium]MEE1543735.1 acyloxyacyl hydrolase [Alphaproteobacteria bacterium]